MIAGKIGIVIVNYNGEKYQNDALRTLYDSDYTNFEVIIVDNNSQDNSVQKAKQEYPQVHFLLQNENVGFARGCNIGIQYAIQTFQVEYILLINNDVEIDKRMISELVANATKDTVCVPKMYYYEPHDMLWFAGGEIRWDRGEGRHFGNFVTDHGQYDESKDITFGTGCCLLIHQNIFRKIGLLDEKLFMYFDDTDFCTRLNLAGYKIKYVPSARLWHKIGSSGGGMDSKVYVYYNTRNKLYFMKHYRAELKPGAYLYTYCKLLAKFLLSPVYKKNDRYILKAWKDYRSGKMGRCDSI